jgi:hypothetical protein
MEFETIFLLITTFLINKQKAHEVLAVEIQCKIHR